MYGTRHNYWRTIALQYCVSLCHTALWIIHGYTNVPSLLSPLSSPYQKQSLDCHKTLGWAPSFTQQSLTCFYFTYGNVYVSMFSSQFAPLSLQPWNWKMLAPWKESYDQPSSVQLLRRVWLFVTPWTAARQASLYITNSQSLLRFMSIESVMPSNHFILRHPLLLLPSIVPSIRVFSNDSALHIRWPKYWSFSFKSVLPKNTQDWSPLGCTGWISLQSKGLSRVFSNTTVQKHQFFSTQLSSQSNSHIHTWPLEKL